mmetsp:Transcript_31061/g.66729  ORF Transcript_31061/g.66729 Transcript_31061/m.66729 type:complete len:242 (+) Transcript_31061:617-1342(+)
MQRSTPCDAVGVRFTRHRVLTPAAASQALPAPGLTLHHVGAWGADQLGFLHTREHCAERCWRCCMRHIALASHRTSRVFYAIWFGDCAREGCAGCGGRPKIWRSVAFSTGWTGAGAPTCSAVACAHALGRGGCTSSGSHFRVSSECMARVRTSIGRGAARLRCGCMRDAKVASGQCDGRQGGLRLLHVAMEDLLRLLHLPAVCKVIDRRCTPLWAWSPRAPALNRPLQFGRVHLLLRACAA